MCIAAIHIYTIAFYHRWEKTLKTLYFMRIVISYGMSRKSIGIFSLLVIIMQDEWQDDPSTKLVGPMDLHHNLQT